MDGRHPSCPRKTGFGKQTPVSLHIFLRFLCASVGSILLYFSSFQNNFVKPLSWIFFLVFWSYHKWPGMARSGWMYGMEFKMKTHFYVRFLRKKLLFMKMCQANEKKTCQWPLIVMVSPRQFLNSISLGFQVGFYGYRMGFILLKEYDKWSWVDLWSA